MSVLPLRQEAKSGKLCTDVKLHAAESSRNGEWKIFIIPYSFVFSEQINFGFENKSL
jgi:hypothetical protein